MVFFIPTYAAIGGGKLAGTTIRVTCWQIVRVAPSPFQISIQTTPISVLDEWIAGTHDTLPLVINTHSDLPPPSIMSFLRLLYPNSKPQSSMRQELCEVSRSECPRSALRET